MTATPRQRFNGSTLQRINLTLANRQRAHAVDLPRLRRMTRVLLVELLQIKQADLGVFLVSASEITRLNKTYLHHAGSTDVIAFNYSDHGTRPLRSPSPIGWEMVGVRALHGEILICVDEAVRQARRFRTTQQSELVRYLVHGVLHLCGYDDHRAAPRRKMKREEDRLLRVIARCFPLSKR